MDFVTGLIMGMEKLILSSPRLKWRFLLIRVFGTPAQGIEKFPKLTSYFGGLNLKETGNVIDWSTRP